MELSWMDELVSAELVLPGWLISEIKTKLHTNGDELMEKMVAYKSACLSIQEFIAKTHPIPDYNYFQHQEKNRDALRRELMVLLRGEETVKKVEIDEQRKKYSY
jgi:hypothetical protein